MGNPLNIAYGGYALGIACKAAVLSVPAGYHLYSIQGNYLGPAYTDRQLRASVRTIRHTRTFATRQVEVSQVRDDGEERVCLIALADFQVEEPASLMVFSRAPSRAWPGWAQCPTQDEAYARLVSEGKVSQGLVDAHAGLFGVTRSLFEKRVCAEGIFAQNLYGMAKTLPHSQDALTVPERSTADWFRSTEVLASYADNVANLAFWIDGAIAFLPLSFSNRWFEDVAAVSSLDFSLRFFRNEVDTRQWHLREMGTRVGGEGRSWGESWVWDEQGRAVACMTQQSILRPKGKGSGKL